MKNRFFIFNGINSFNKGIILKNHPIITKPKLRDDGIVIDGRNGKLYYADKIYDSYTRTLECAIITDDYDIRDIISWLNGSGEMIFSDEPDKFYKVNIINQIDFTNIADKIHEFPLIVDIQPFAYSLEENTIEVTENTTIQIENSTVNVKPKIKIYGTGDVTLNINNKSQIIYNIDEYIELDSELEIAYKDYQNKNPLVYGEYFELNPGDNYIDFLGDVTKIEIKYRDTYL